MGFLAAWSRLAQAEVAYEAVLERRRLRGGDHPGSSEILRSREQKDARAAYAALFGLPAPETGRRVTSIGGLYYAACYPLLWRGEGRGVEQAAGWVHAP